MQSGLPLVSKQEPSPRIDGDVLPTNLLIDNTNRPSSLDTFDSYANHRSQMAKMQLQMGRAGVLANFRDPGQEQFGDPIARHVVRATVQIEQEQRHIALLECLEHGEAVVRARTCNASRRNT